MADLLSGLWSGAPARPALRPRDWELLLGQARRAGLLARLALRLEAADGGLAALPEAPARLLRASLAIVERQRHEVLAELAQLRRALRGLDGPVVLLKGAAYQLAGLPPARGRLFSDVDLLVERSHLLRAEGLLFAAGWISQERDAYNQRYYRQWMHEIPPLEHVQRHSVVDLHHTIAPPTSRFRIDAAKLFERIRPIGASGFHMLAPEDMVLHSAAHLYQEGEFDRGLRDLLDLDDLLEHFGREPGFWPGLLARAAELGLGEPLFLLLDQRCRLFGRRPPADCTPALAALRPGPLRRWALGRLLRLALRPHHPSCDDAASRAARWLLYVRSHRLRMPLHLLLPHLLRKAYMSRFPAVAALPQPPA
ncbi:nucleotidyltransferase domain-containing protein [Roseateles violae]|uniref:Nucleotidyltransferase family protein n=1 Tax=Roseateles violae TaxID=3058042 RepID=A0ABT8DNI0_9BURK|nr:nucleotidyltransferase family protein [Pelomonas sp. PFR6]MDN3919518.1 nucleotidyltransferase family protein [Pelomonas sp. PFR6]